MNEQKNQMQKQEAAPKTTDGAAATKPSSWKRLLAKKWVFPATYMAAAAIILTLMWVYQDSGTKSLSEKDLGMNSGDSSISDTSKILDNALPVTVPTEEMVWPVENFSDLVVIMPFFDSAGTSEEKQAAMIEYGNTLMPNTGISLTRPDNETFNVQAAMSGKVTRVEKLPLIGNLVEISHENGLKTIYESLSDVTVIQNAEVKQGDVIAKAGRNELEKALGFHLHFEVHQNGVIMNPETFIDQN